MKPRVAILLESSLEVSRRILSGIVSFMDRHEPWIVDFIPGALCEQRLPDQWRGDGIIARIPSPKEAERLAYNPAPKVIFDPLDEYTQPSHPLSRWPRIECDNVECGAAAARHLVRQGFSNFAYVDATPSSAPGMTTDCSWPRLANWRHLRERGFADALKKRGFAYTAYPNPSRNDESYNANIERPRLVRFLKSLPKPVAVFCPNDARGRQVTDACLYADIPVPYQVGVIGVNDDATICNFSQPPLSSIPLDAETAGRKAAAALAALMRGRQNVDSYRYRPLAPVTRISTLNLQTNDQLVISVLEKIHSHKGFNMRATEIAEDCSISLRHLEKKFRAELGRSLGDVIRTTCMENVLGLVNGTDMPFKDIAAKAGHRSVSHLSGAFRERFGITMTEARSKAALMGHGRIHPR